MRVFSWTTPYMWHVYQHCHLMGVDGRSTRVVRHRPVMFLFFLVTNKQRRRRREKKRRKREKRQEKGLLFFIGARTRVLWAMLASFVRFVRGTFCLWGCCRVCLLYEANVACTTARGKIVPPFALVVSVQTRRQLTRMLVLFFWQVFFRFYCGFQQRTV